MTAELSCENIKNFLASREGKARNTTESISRAQAVNTVSHFNVLCKMFETENFAKVFDLPFDQFKSTMENYVGSRGEKLSEKTIANKLESMITVLKEYAPVKAYLGDKYKTYLKQIMDYKNNAKTTAQSNLQIKKQENPISPEELVERFENVFKMEEILAKDRRKDEASNTAYIIFLMYTYGGFEQRVSKDTITFIPRLSLDKIIIDFEDEPQLIDEEDAKFYHVKTGRMVLKGKGSSKTGAIYSYDYILPKYARERILESIDDFPRIYLVDRTPATIGDIFKREMMKHLKVQFTNTMLRHTYETVYNLIGVTPARMSLALGHSVTTGVAIYREQLDNKDAVYRELITAFMKTLKNKLV
jgi:hypothetical protein